MSLGSLERVPRLRPAQGWAGDSDPSNLATVAVRLSALAGAGLLGIIAIVALVALGMVPALRSAAGAVEIDLSTGTAEALPDLDQRSIVYAADGSVLAVLHDEVDRRVVALEEVPAHVRQAVITAEDRKFYEHPGYDVEGIGRAFVANARARSVTQGGSTLTQQLAKANFVGGDQTVQRKIDELLHAVALERRFSKDWLLERYLNQVYFGSGAYGIAAAAEEYFQVDPENLTVEQAALLAGMIQAPSDLDPRRNPAGALARRNRVLAGMAEEGYLPLDEVEPRQAVPVIVVENIPRTSSQPYFVEAVKDEFFRTSAFGEDRQDRIDRLFNGGLAIHTTLDPRMQAIASDVVKNQFPEAGGPTGAIAAVDPRNGRIMALHGGSDFTTQQFDVARLGRRQPGSAFKPFVYAAALEEGFPSSMTLQGRSPAYFDDVPGWSREDNGVRNYGNSSYGRLDMREALVRSANTAAAQLMLLVGTGPVLDLSARMGIDVEAMTQGVHNPSIALGGATRGVTPLEMASAFGTFANDGNYLPPHVIDHVKDAAGNEVYVAETRPERALEPEVSEVIVDIMQDVVSRGTGTRARLSGWEPMGKTGTTQNNNDAWFVGSVPVLSTAVWMGHVGRNVPMRGVTGGSVPATMWREFMAAALEGVEPVAFVHSGGGAEALEVRAELDVPDLRRMDEAEALAELTELQLVGRVSSVASSSPAGTVVWQSPREGATVTKGATVTLGVSTGRPPRPPPRPEPSPDPSEDEPDSSGAPGDAPTVRGSPGPPDAPLAPPPPRESRPPPEAGLPTPGGAG
ncbi:MAG: transglycosylase domain-containing protein [Egibacteraceae bacterium]